MRFLTCAAAVCAFTAAAKAGDTDLYNRYFLDATLRVDYFHTGTKGSETISLGRVSEEGPWPGSRVNLIDTLDLGEFQFRVYDRSTNVLIFSRGYSTIFNEWQTTDEAAAGTVRTFSESVRFPSPRRVVQLAIARRDRRMVFHEIFSTIIDPGNPAEISRPPRHVHHKVVPILESGNPSHKVDIVILGDGYTRTEMGKLERDAGHFTDVMFSTHPFDTRRSDFNVWLVEVESAESGIDIPDKGIWKDHALGAAYNTFGSARYVLTTENTAVRDIAAEAPYDFLCILVNDSRYGGGGIFNLYTTTYTGEEVKGQEWQQDYVYVHEFGHCFAGLGDEYYTSSTGYNDFYPAGVEPWEPNVTALLDGKHVKWGAKVTSGVPIPTPWEKTSYDSLEALRGKLDRLAPDYYEKREPYFRAEREILDRSRYAGKVGAFEGSGYASVGLYRPAVDCRMFSLSLVGFDPVCSAAILRMIDFIAR